MKNRSTTNSREKSVPENAFIVTKTDSKGRIAYANRLFLELSGYQEGEILGKSHNVIRHPEMPRGIFKLLWDSIKSGQEFNGYIKNLCKDGGFYWVFANITPSLKNGELLGYYSVRRKARDAALPQIQNLYQDMLAAEANVDTTEAVTASLSLLNSRLNQHSVSYDQYVLTLA